MAPRDGGGLDVREARQEAEREAAVHGLDLDTVLAVATPERAVRVIAGLLGPTVGFGPVPAGPNDMATASATGSVGRVTARREGLLRVQVRVPVALDVSVLIGSRRIPAEVDLVVHVGLVGRAAPGAVEIDVDPIRPADVDADVRTRGVGGVFLRRLGDLDAEIRHHVGVYVSTLLATPEAVAECRIRIP
ncbi:hypothetical protein [Actinomycetospora cinnamomea]|uniref:Uncharacterized protein n=1 Tax=Actinomycetospora cinnamomea TaxID=663609 RepID=A0A2U1F6G3_9PSEU|nr:hypothetical protein [Actinomycetospora cinnamomea]PVZ07775.1 hypothetical protein C8D89_111146 [Actinomycetospora cinnamomea]